MAKNKLLASCVATVSLLMPTAKSQPLYLLLTFYQLCATMEIWGKFFSPLFR